MVATIALCILLTVSPSQVPVEPIVQFYKVPSKPPSLLEKWNDLLWRYSSWTKPCLKTKQWKLCAAVNKDNVDTWFVWSF